MRARDAMGLQCFGQENMGQGVCGLQDVVPEVWEARRFVVKGYRNLSRSGAMEVISEDTEIILCQR